MIATIAVCAVLLMSAVCPRTEAPVALEEHASRQSSDAVTMDGDEMDRLIWYLYYGEWVSGGDEKTSDAGEPASEVDNEAAWKTSSK